MKGLIMMKKNALNFVCAFFICAAFTVMGCGGQEKGLRLGERVPETGTLVKLADVLDAPADYNGKNIVLQGTVASQCAALCDFKFQDGSKNITVYPKGFKLTKLETGKPVTIYAEVIKGEGQTVFSLLGLEME